MALLSFVRRAAGAAALAAFAGGCEFLHPPTYTGGDPAQLVVHAVLQAGADSATVVVARVGVGEAQPVTGAQVRLVGGGATTVLPDTRPASIQACRPVAEVPGQGPATGSGCYSAAVPGGVRAGAEYQLEVDLPSGERVRGRTVVPAAPALDGTGERLRVPARMTEWGTLRSVSPFTVRWTSTEPVSVWGQSMRGWVRNAAVTCAASVLRDDDVPVAARPDSVRLAVEVHACNSGPDNQNVRPDSVEVRVSVTAYDSAYVAYFREYEGGIPLEQASKGLEGAFGLFGSAASAYRHVIVYRQ
ncbi:MAG TPA: DUF4249 family protein [Longimicrobium sp.]|nr:DUF4249 family protein [Longimicrobium sp.]